MEPDVLKGARQTIARTRPLIFAEYSLCGEEAIYQALPDYYRPVKVSDSDMILMVKDDPMWANITVLDPQ
jgi:hypothetical protein